MSVTTFLATVAKVVGKAGEWLKVYFQAKTGEKREASPNSIIKIAKKASTGEIKISYYYFNLVADKSSPRYNEESVQKVLDSASQLVKEHAGIVMLDDSIPISRVATVTDTQQNQLKLFRKVGWSPDKINSIRVAFKIVNLEDHGSYEEAKKLMESAFNGRKRVLNKKFYNLARAGYLNGFALDIVMGGGPRDDDKINALLEYFPPAIFIDESFGPTEMIDELKRRKSNEVLSVNLYARGQRRIEVMEDAYGQYLKEEISQAEKGKIKRITIYMLNKKTLHKIGPVDAEDIEVTLKDLRIEEYGLFTDMLRIPKNQKTF
jgi:hypothetical protein